MDLKTYKSKSEKEKKIFIQEIYKNKEFIQPNVTTVKPNWVDGLYCDLLFPNETFRCSTFTIDEDNIFNGSLIVTDDQVILHWKGYATRLYDGELDFYTMDEDAVIEGVCDGKDFRINRNKLEFGVWPGFIMIRDHQ